MISLFLALTPESSEAAPCSEDEVQRLAAAAQRGEQVAAIKLYRLHVSRLFRTADPQAVVRRADAGGADRHDDPLDGTEP